MSTMFSIYDRIADLCVGCGSAGAAAAAAADEGLFINMLRLHYDLWSVLTSEQCVVCAPLSVSLGGEVSREDMKSHILLNTKIPGEFLSLNGKTVRMVGTEVHTHAGFEEQRRVRILSVDHLVEDTKEITVFRLSRPLVGGIKAPEESDEVDSDSMRKYVTILRSYPEVESIFKEMDAFIAEVNFVGENSDDGFNRVTPSLEACVCGQWQASVDKLLNSRCFSDSFGSGASNRLLMSQIVESYIMNGIYLTVFPYMLQRNTQENAAFAEVLNHTRYHSLADLGLRPEFQCPVTAAIKEMITLPRRRAPVDKLLCLKRVWGLMRDCVESNVARNHLNRSDLDLSSDDLLQMLKYVIIQSQPYSGDLLTQLYYINSFHLVSLSTSQLGFIFSNVVTATSWFKAKIDGSIGILDKTVEDEIPSEYLTISSCMSDLHYVINDRHAKSFGRKELVNVYSGLTSHPTTSGCAEEKKSHINVEEQKGSNEIAGSTVMTFGNSDARYNGEFSQTQDVITERDGFERKTAAAHIACGQQYYSVVTQQGDLYTWGLSTCGRLGQGPDLDVYFAESKPILVVSLISDIITQVSCGPNHMLAVTSSGEVYAWGDNRCGQLGLGDVSLRGGEKNEDALSGLTTQSTPKQVDALKGVQISQVACGAWHSICLSTDGQVYTWGRGTSGRLGQFGDRVGNGFKSDPTKFSPGLVRCDWRTYVMELDDSPSEQAKTPLLACAPPPSYLYKWADSDCESKVIKIAAGWAHSVAITNTGAVFTWGCGGDGRLGHGGHFDVYIPQQVRALASAHIIATSCAAGYAHTVVSTADGLLFAFGLNKFGQVGAQTSQLPPSSTMSKHRKDKHSICCPVPILLPPLADDTIARVTSVHCGDSHTVVVDGGGRVYGWGLNHCDQLAQGAAVEFMETPTQIPLLAKRAKQVACGGNHTMCVL